MLKIKRFEEEIEQQSKMKEMLKSDREKFVEYVFRNCDAEPQVKMEFMNLFKLLLDVEPPSYKKTV